MVSPIDYSLNVQAPFQSALQGYQFGAQIGSAAQDQRQAEAARQQALQQQQIMQADLRKIISDPAATPRDFANLTLKYPSFAAPFKQAASLMSEDQKASTIKFESQIYAALDSGATSIAKDMFQERADKMRAAGDVHGASDAERAIKLIDVNPTIARNMLGNKLVAMDEKLAGSLSALGGERRENAKFPTALRKETALASDAEGKAQITAVEAANAPTRVGLENANIESTIQDRAAGQAVAQGQLGVAQENAMTGRGNLTLEQQKLAATQTEKKTADSTAAQNQRVALSQAQDTLASIKGHPAIDGFLTGAGTIGGKQLEYIPGTQRKELRGLIDTFKSQQFLSELAKLKAGGPSGLGGLTESEGERLVNAIGKLDPDMKPEAFRNAIGVIEKTLNSAQSRITASGKAPTTGGAFIMKIPGVGDVNEGDVNRLLQKNPGSTREQVLQYLQQRAGKGGGATGGY